MLKNKIHKNQKIKVAIACVKTCVDYRYGFRYELKHENEDLHPARIYTDDLLWTIIRIHVYQTLELPLPMVYEKDFRGKVSLSTYEIDEDITLPGNVLWSFKKVVDARDWLQFVSLIKDQKIEELFWLQIRSIVYAYYGLKMPKYHEKKGGN